MRRLKRPFRWCCGQMLELYHRLLGDDIYEEVEHDDKFDALRRINESGDKAAEQADEGHS